MVSVSFVIALLLAPFSLLTLCLTVELFAGLRPLPQLAATGQGARAVIIVPAHNEEGILASQLRDLKLAAQEQAHILLVADNCTDGTAKIATNMGVEVVERNDHVRRGKGYALDFARQHLHANPPAIVIVIDADCRTDTDSIAALIKACASSGRPCQATYVLDPVPDGPPTLQVSTFAFYIKNVVRQRALQRLARRAQLLGTGMALPWPLFDRLELATSNIVEDLEMGIQLAEAGYPSLAVAEALVSSRPASRKDTLNQRRRWEGGYLKSAMRWVPRIIGRSLASGDLRGLWTAINLLIPPLALLMLLDVAAIGFALAAHWLTGVAIWPAALLGTTLALAALGLVIAWIAGGSRYISLSGLAQIPLYLIWKLPLYLSLARHGPPKEWLRTRRE